MKTMKKLQPWFSKHKRVHSFNGTTSNVQVSPPSKPEREIEEPVLVDLYPDDDNGSGDIRVADLYPDCEDSGRPAVADAGASNASKAAAVEKNNAATNGATPPRTSRRTIEDPYALRTTNDIPWKEITVTLSDDSDSDDSDSDGNHQVAPTAQVELPAVNSRLPATRRHVRSASWTDSCDHLAVLDGDLPSPSVESQLSSALDLHDHQKKSTARDFKFKYQFEKQAKLEEDLLGWLGAKAADAGSALTPLTTVPIKTVNNVAQAGKHLAMMTRSATMANPVMTRSATMTLPPTKRPSSMGRDSRTTSLSRSPPPTPSRRPPVPRSPTSGSSPHSTFQRSENMSPKHATQSANPQAVRGRHRKCVSLGAGDFNFSMDSLAGHVPGAVLELAVADPPVSQKTAASSLSPTADDPLPLPPRLRKGSLGSAAGPEMQKRLQQMMEQESGQPDTQARAATGRCVWELEGRQHSSLGSRSGTEIQGQLRQMEADEREERQQGLQPAMMRARSGKESGQGWKVAGSLGSRSGAEIQRHLRQVEVDERLARQQRPQPMMMKSRSYKEGREKEGGTGATSGEDFFARSNTMQDRGTRGMQDQWSRKPQSRRTLGSVLFAKEESLDTSSTENVVGRSASARFVGEELLEPTSRGEYGRPTREASPRGTDVAARGHALRQGHGEKPRNGSFRFHN